MRTKGKTVFKRSGSDFYYYRTGAGGKNWHCTYETDKKKAEKKALEHRSATRGGFDLETLFEMLEVKLDALPENVRDAQRVNYGNRLLRLKPDILPFAEAWDRWVKMPNKSKHGNPAPHTIEGYRSIWTRFEKWATSHKLVHLHETTAKHAEEYMADAWATGISERTYMATLKQLRSMFKTLKLQAGIVLNPFAEIQAMELGTVTREAYTQKELTTICTKATGDWRYLVGIGIYTGLRLTDALHLKWENIVNGIITVIPAKVKRRKKAKDREVKIPVHPVLDALLSELRQLRGGNPTGNLFPALVRQYAKEQSAPSLAFGKFLRDECGITTTAEVEEGSQRKRRANVRGYHSLRHSFVSMAAESKIPLTTIQSVVGHASPAMTSYYAHTEDEAKRQAFNLLPSGFFEVEQK